MASNLEFVLPLKGKLAIVTGASRGLGTGMAWELARRGADVCITYVSESSAKTAQELAERIDGLPHKPKTYLVRANISTLDGPKQIISSLLEQIGTNLKVDILVNNAGVEVNKALSEVSLEDYNSIFDLNVRGVILLTQAVLPYLPPKGRIINISSVAARAAFANLSLYCASKAALEGLTRSWAAELGHNGTTVNTVDPGPVETELLSRIPRDLINKQFEWTPVEKRAGTIEEIGKVVAWLASEDASWISGQSISASGGFMIN